MTLLRQFLEEHASLGAGECREDIVCIVSGRVSAVRNASSKLRFYDIREKDTRTILSEDTKLQVNCML